MCLFSQSFDLFGSLLWIWQPKIKNCDFSLEIHFFHFEPQKICCPPPIFLFDYQYILPQQHLGPNLIYSFLFSKKEFSERENQATFLTSVRRLYENSHVSQNALTFKSKKLFL